MLELERQFLIKLANLSLRIEIFDRSLNETLGNLERGFDLDPRCRTGIEDRDRAGHQGGKEIDQSDEFTVPLCAITTSSFIKQRRSKSGGTNGR